MLIHDSQSLLHALSYPLRLTLFKTLLPLSSALPFLANGRHTHPQNLLPFLSKSNSSN